MKTLNFRVAGETTVAELKNTLQHLVEYVALHEEQLYFMGLGYYKTVRNVGNTMIAILQ